MVTNTIYNTLIEPDPFLLIFPLALALVFFLVWRFHGQFFFVKPTIITEFTPPKGIGPAEAGVIFSGHVSDQALTGEIIQLAVDGHIKIIPVSQNGLDQLDFYLHKLNDIHDKDHWYRRVLMNLLFSSGRDLRLSEISQRLDGRGWSDLKNQLMFGLKSKGYYYRVTGLSKILYFLLAVWFSYFLIVSFNGSALAVISGLITFMVIVFAGSFLTIKTAKGREMARYLAGFKRYLDVAEKDRLSFHNNPKKRFNNFEKILPYAVALDIPGRWDNEFASLFSQKQNRRVMFGPDVRLD